MVPLRKDIEPVGVSAFFPGAEAFAFVNHLRFTAMKCRAKPQAELFRACALLQVNATADREAHSEALMMCLSEALGQPARLLAPGAAELTFDEQWLIQLGLACASDDDLSISFLLRSRVAHENQRLVRFLVSRIVDCFPLI